MQQTCCLLSYYSNTNKMSSYLCKIGITVKLVVCYEWQAFEVKPVQNTQASLN